MADKNWEQQQGRGPYGYRHRYGGGYQEDHNHGSRSTAGGQAYGRNEEEGYTQDMGRQHSDMEGNRSHIITGNRGSDYAQAYGRGESERYNAGTGYGSRDPRMTGPHRGKGPRNYERSQDRIREDVCERLTDDAMIDATNVEVRVENNEVVLSGTVHNREEKRRAEDLVESVAGVRNVDNRLRVEPRSGSDTNAYREYDEEGRIKSGGR
jgi:hypothetical protein